MIPPGKLCTDGYFTPVGELLQRLDGQDATEVNGGLGGNAPVLPLDVFGEGREVLSSFNLVKTMYRFDSMR